MTKNLKLATISAIIWSTIQRLSQQGAQFIISIILARILLPKEYGLVAMLYVFIAISQSIIDSGFGKALIQKKNSTYVDENSIFYFNNLISIIFIIILHFLAPYIGSFYNQPELVLMIRVLSLTLFLNSLSLIHRILLSKKLNFKIQLKSGITATISSGIISIILAKNGFGVWSLIIQQLSYELTNTILLWILFKWSPSFSFSFDSLKSMFGFGSKLLFVSLTDSIFKNMYSIIIGKFFTPTILGFYNRADSLYKYPINIINSIVSQVTFPLYSQINEDKALLRDTLKKTTSKLMFIVLPIMIGLIVIARPLILVLLTEKWLPSSIYLQLLCIVGILMPLQVINMNVLNAQGRSDLFMKLDFFKKIFIITTIATLYKYGVIAIIIGQIIINIIAYILSTYYSKILLNYSIKNQIAEFTPSLLLSLIMGGIIFSFTLIGIENYKLLLLLQIIFGFSTYCILSYLLKIPAFLEYLSIFKIILNYKKNKK